MTVSELTCEEKRISKLDCCEAEGEMTDAELTDNPVADLVRTVRAAYEPTLARLMRWLVRVFWGEPDPPLPPFQERPVCPKCQYPGLLADFHMWHIPERDALERTCPRCGAKWLMRTADAEETQP